MIQLVQIIALWKKKLVFLSYQIKIFILNAKSLKKRTGRHPKIRKYKYYVYMVHNNAKSLGNMNDTLPTNLILSLF